MFNQLIKNFQNQFSNTTIDDGEWEMTHAEQYVQSFPINERRVALKSLNNFFDRWESGENARMYYASVGIGESFYQNALVLEGALIDSI